MRFAIIDCGTNTFHLLIAETGDGVNPEIIFKTKAVVKLAEGGILQKNIQPQPYKRGLHALSLFRKKIDQYGVKHITACGTAALRSAKNGKAFVNDVWKQHRIRLEVITGNREAGLIYKGVMMALHPGKGNSLIIDIGGGSTEFIICNEKKIFWKKSFPLGAALLLEMFHPSDPVTRKEIQLITAHHRKILEPLLLACHEWKPERLIGSSGSFDTFAEMIVLNTPDYNILEGKTEYRFKMKDYHFVHRILMASTTAERMNMKGLVKMRVDMIVMASLQLTFVLRQTGIKKMLLSTYALKEGLLKEMIDRYGKSKR